MKFDGNRIFSFMLAAAFALTLAGCGGGGGTAATEPPPMPDPQMECEGAGGRYNADMTCTSAEELLMERQAAQRSAISSAIGAASDAVAAVNDDSTDAEVMAANAAIEAANAAVANAADIPEAEKAANSGAVSQIEGRLSAALESRMAAMDAADEAARMAMMATAMKLHAGISAPVAGTGADALNAAYSNSNAGPDIAVQIGTPAAVDLTENKDATVAAHYGWQGQMFTASPEDGGTYEAVVYSNVGDPTEGEKFSEEYSANFANGTLDETTTESDAARVASPSFDQSAGVKPFEKGSNDIAVMIAGSYHGVSGTYSCVPSDGNKCAARVATSGFELGGITDANVFGAANASWTFKPTDPEARLMDMPDDTYASYGWWIHKSADGETFTASAFAADRGTVDAASGLDTLLGTATYMGGAAGKYALRSLTGGTNDAGHFTARATLEADFTNSMVTGTIDNFMGADGQPRNWSVELKESGVNESGNIIGEAGTGDDQMQTVWSMDGTAAAAAGGWQGTLKDNGVDGVPKVGTGTFTSMFGADGNMVGAFGVNKQ